MHFKVGIIVHTSTGKKLEKEILSIRKVLHTNPNKTNRHFFILSICLIYCILIFLQLKFLFKLSALKESMLSFIRNEKLNINFNLSRGTKSDICMAMAQIHVVCRPNFKNWNTSFLLFFSLNISMFLCLMQRY